MLSVQQQPKILMIATHPRSTSTALERAFLTRKDLVCIHEPFGEAFYYGPERMSDRYSDKECSGSDYSSTDFNSVVNDIMEKARSAPSSPQQQTSSSRNEQPSSSPQLLQDNTTVPTIVIKDMAQYFIPPKEHGLAGKNHIVAKSLEDFVLPVSTDNGTKSHGNDVLPVPNPTLLPEEFLTSMRYVFLIRPPHLSVPSYYRCCIPPQSNETGFDHYRSSEAGYRELRILYDYVSALAARTGSVKQPIIVDSLDLIANPEPLVQRICQQGDFPFDEAMLSWGENAAYETQLFEKWKGFHNDALSSTGFKRSSTPGAPAREVQQADTTKDDFVIDYAAWRNKWNQRFNNDERIVSDIENSVREHMDDYLYLRSRRMVV
ncbi:uncharacterized protein SAPINGB_P000176 [Magnusiomyces paraingens]|uniref:Sulfotransferase domain-containing protein n=1 Tax=Magnusiomyces paraingens TaxID=2606893 RepID=A0A5E8AYL5_9ASCO|nr:uncharacterized protein SAPINGB_P000176 [Saprochaete ingens]VVT43848.1 unnamed protein product [Saprochaete ingens]